MTTVAVVENIRSTGTEVAEKVMYSETSRSPEFQPKFSADYQPEKFGVFSSIGAS